MKNNAGSGDLINIHDEQPDKDDNSNSTNTTILADALSDELGLNVITDQAISNEVDIDNHE